MISVISEDYVKERGIVGEDIHEGKRTIMVIHSYFKGKNGDRLLEILNMRTEREELLREAISILRDNKSIEYAQDRSREILNKAWDELKVEMPKNKYVRDLEDLN